MRLSTKWLIPVLSLLLIGKFIHAEPGEELPDLVAMEDEAPKDQGGQRAPAKATRKAPSRTRKQVEAVKSLSSDSELNEALKLARKGQYQQASVKLFQLMQSPRYDD